MTYEIEDEQIGPSRQRFSLEAVAQFVETINDEIAKHPDRHPELTLEDRETWAGYPAQIRAHRYKFVNLDPNRPILDYLKSGHIGPNYPTKSISIEEGTVCK